MDRFVRLSDDERQRYFVQTAERMGLGPQVIEKDFWVCWTLRELFSLPGIGSGKLISTRGRDVELPIASGGEDNRGISGIRPHSSFEVRFYVIIKTIIISVLYRIKV